MTTSSENAEDGLGQRWKLYLAASLFYLLAGLSFAIFVSLYRYPDIANVAGNAEEAIRDIHGVAFKLRWLFYLFVAVGVSPWLVNRAQTLKISQISEDNDNGNSSFGLLYFLLVFVAGLLLAYFWQPRTMSLSWGKGLENLFSIFTYVNENESFSRELISNLPLVIMTTLLTFTLFRVVFGSNQERLNVSSETVLASGTLLTAIMLLTLVFSHDFSIVWASMVLLSLPSTLLFVGTVSWWRDSQIEWYVPLISFVFLIVVPTALLFWARNKEYSVDWILAIMAALAGILLLITSALVSRDTTRVKEVIEKNLKNPPSITFPRVNLKLIRQTRASTPWAAVNLIVDMLAVIGVTFVNTVARAGHFLINRIIMPASETITHALLWLLVQFFNLLMIFFAHLVFAIINLPAFLQKVLIVILEALEINLRYIFFQVITLLAFATTIAFSVHFAVDYFLTGKGGLIMGILGAGIVGIFSIVFSLSLLFRVSFFKGFNFYLRALSELLSYSLLVICAACWLFVFLSPRFGIENFKPGLITWSTTAILILAIPLAYLFREKSVNHEAV